MGESTQPVVVGAYGKLPSRGDFVRRRLPNAFVAPWDEWMQQAIIRSREDLAEQWLQLYLNGPIWRFVLAPPLIGEEPAAGLFMPSVDSVQRMFPLTLATLLAPGVNPFAIVIDDVWFSALEDIGLACLDADFAPEGLDARLDALAPPTCAGGQYLALDRCGDGAGGHGAWFIAPDRDAYATQLYPALLDHLVRETAGAYSLWWTSGSDAVEPSFRIIRGFPEPEAFSAFLTDGITARPAAVGPVLRDDTGIFDATLGEET